MEALATELALEREALAEAVAEDNKLEPVAVTELNREEAVWPEVKLLVFVLKLISSGLYCSCSSSKSSRQQHQDVSYQSWRSSWR